MARRRRVVWTQQGRLTLEEAIDYVAKNSISAAQGILVEVLDAATSLSLMGERGRIVPELNSPAIREIFVNRYRLIYEVYSDRVEILAIIHGARDFTHWRSSNTDAD